MTEEQERKRPTYPLGYIKREAERLRRQHAWQQACLNNQIVFAPVDLQKPGLKVLDVGCADGSLLRDLKEQLPPSARLVGIDLTAAFLPESLEENIRYVIGNVCEPPAHELKGTFDLTHLRYLLVGCGKVSIDTPISNLVATLAPGGWLQVQELDARVDSTTQGAFADLLRILAAIWNKTGIGADCVSELQEAFVRAGLENVSIQHLRLPIGKKFSTEDEPNNVSLQPFKLTIPNVCRGAKALGLDLPASIFDRLEERFEKEMLEEGAIQTSIVVCGQKPL